MDKKIEKLLKRVEKPARYIGGEYNSIIKDPADIRLRFGFCFPDLYEIGMSYLGLQILYNIINRDERVWCERIFAPAPDMEKLLREENIKLFTLESQTPLSELDILGFTLQYEMCYTGLLAVLELGGLPLSSKERLSSDEKYPFVIVGGPCAFNPEPLTDFVDIVCIGDGEEQLPKLTEAYMAWKESGSEKIEFLRAAADIEGVYVPSFYRHEYAEDGRLISIETLDPSAKELVEKAMAVDLDKALFPEKTIVPFIEVVHDRSVIETFRGCLRGCRFCQAGMIYRPVRERSVENIKDLAIKQLTDSGHEELSLLSLSTSDYSRFEELATGLMALCRERNVSLSLPSLRLDSFSFRVLDEIQRYKKSGLTFAPEAGTQRLRDVINKGITEDDIYSAVRQAIELGWMHIKLYFMIGLPTESYEDLDGIADIARNIVDMYKDTHMGKVGRFKVSVSVSNFVPKPFTPFQWAKQDSPESFIEKHNYLKNKLNFKGVSFSYHESYTSELEAVFARGDRRLGKVLKRAYELGCRLDGWSEYFREDLWRQAFYDSGIDMSFYTVRERSFDELLPWDSLSPRVSREYLIAEAERAEKGIVTGDCRGKCHACGIQKSISCPAAGMKKLGEAYV